MSEARSDTLFNNNQEMRQPMFTVFKWLIICLINLFRETFYSILLSYFFISMADILAWVACYICHSTSSVHECLMLWKAFSAVQNTPSCCSQWLICLHFGYLVIIHDKEPLSSAYYWLALPLCLSWSELTPAWHQRVFSPVFNQARVT